MHKLVLTIYFEQYLPCTQETILFTRQKSPRIKTQWQYFLLGEKISAGVKNPYEERTLQLLQFALDRSICIPVIQHQTGAVSAAKSQ